MNREEIKQIIPHREPMLLVDNAEVADGIATAQYTVRENEFFTQGHFPGNPIVPGVILCEMMAQGSAILLKDDLAGKLALYAGVDGVRFKRQVRPGDTVITHSTIIGKKGPLIVVEAEATVDGVMCCKGKLSFMLTKLL
ncbi:MAG: 3-hydroxyacyl-ACP dehydratase FabZ [Paludibacteraceae bacterium]